LSEEYVSNIYFSLRIAGRDHIARLTWAYRYISDTNRSSRLPQPPVGGMPYFQGARIKVQPSVNTSLSLIAQLPFFAFILRFWKRAA